MTLRRLILRRCAPLLAALPVALFIALLAAAGAPVAAAQGYETATRRSEVSVFAAAEALHPDYSGAGTDGGVLGGVDYTRFFRSPVVPSFELRGTYAGRGNVAGEKTVLGGVRLDLRLGHFRALRPYVDFLVGVGEIDFAHPAPSPMGPYAHDNSVVYNYGFGVNYEVARHIALLAEFQQQQWNLSGSSDPYKLSPYQFDLGLRYRIPFRPRNHQY